MVLKGGLIPFYLSPRIKCSMNKNKMPFGLTTPHQKRHITIQADTESLRWHDIYKLLIENIRYKAQILNLKLNWRPLQTPNEQRLSNRRILIVLKQRSNDCRWAVKATPRLDTSFTWEGPAAHSGWKSSKRLQGRQYGSGHLGDHCHRKPVGKKHTAQSHEPAWEKHLPWLLKDVLEAGNQPRLAKGWNLQSA